MGHRTFRDDGGCLWQVWDTQPSDQSRVAVAPSYQEGWLSFECLGMAGAEAEAAVDAGESSGDARPSGERRRLTFIPADWDSLSDAELRRLLARAELIPRPTRTTPIPEPGRTRNE